MKKNVVVYYSRTGNNKFLAEKISKALNCEIVAIRPWMNLFLLQLLLKTGGGIKSLGVNLEEFQNVILCGPIWMGRLVAPLRGFVQRYGSQINRLYFATCCASGDEMKNEKFGHGPVFQILKGLLGDKCQHCEAFPVGLVAEGAEKKNSDTLMKIRLSDDNFTGEIQKRLDGFVRLVD